MDFICGSVDLISRRISSMAFERKDERGVDDFGEWSRIPLIKSSNERWKNKSIIDEFTTDWVLKVLGEHYKVFLSGKMEQTLVPSDFMSEI